jgi:transcriptional regulator
MYVPKHFSETRVDVMHQLIRTCPFGTLVVMTPDGLEANHVPFVLGAEPAPYGTLRAHVARANALWSTFSSEVEALVVFQGPQAYISPSWYETKRETGKVVPTWNYAIVQARGHARIMDDRDWLAEQIDELTGTHEAGRTDPWHVSDAPEAFIEAQIKGIIGIEIEIASLVGKWKVSQNRPAPDREGVVKGLGEERDDAASLEMAKIVRKYSERAGR